MRVLNGVQQARQAFAERGLENIDNDGTLQAAKQAVDDILTAVRRNGDEAVLTLTARYDGVRPEHLRVPSQWLETAKTNLNPDLLEAMQLAVQRIEAFYQHQPKEGFIHQDAHGILGQLVRPLERIACYVPGGTAPLFSSLLMLAVPARVAGVPHIVVATPPRRDGSMAPEVLAAAALLGIDEVYCMGGAQAVAALAYGTQSVAKVDKIVGPGNRYVMLAKQAVYGSVGIEALPGPTETLVIADAHADPAHVAADLLAQAEHGGAQPVLVSTSRQLLETTQHALSEQLATLSTAEAARESLEQRGYAVLVDNLHEALEVANCYAPEHLCLLVRDPWALLPYVQHAGGVFIGEHSMEALGDYIAGPSHVMPTGATARFSSAVNVRDFQKVIPLVSLSAAALETIAEPAAKMARAEGLEAHAQAIESRQPKQNPHD